MEQLKEQVREAASAIRNWLKEPKNKWLVGTGLLAFFYLTRLLAQFLNNWHGWAPGKELYLPSLNSLKRLVMLFTPYGVQSVIGLFAFCLIASLLYWMNKEDCSGMTYDKERKFWISNKGVYGTAGWMDQKALTNCFDLTPVEQAGEVKEIIFGVKDGIVVSRKEDSQLGPHIAVMGSSGSMKSRTVSRGMIIACAKQGRSLVVTDPNGKEVLGYILQAVH